MVILENTIIPLLPDRPCNQDDDAIEIFSSLGSNLVLAVEHQSMKDLMTGVIVERPHQSNNQLQIMFEIEQPTRR